MDKSARDNRQPLPLFVCLFSVWKVSACLQMCMVGDVWENMAVTHALAQLRLAWKHGEQNEYGEHMVSLDWKSYWQHGCCFCS